MPLNIFKTQDGVRGKTGSFELWIVCWKFFSSLPMSLLQGRVLTTFSEQSQLTWETTNFAVSQNWSAIHFDEKICKNRDQNFDIIICSIRTGASPNNNNIQGKPPFFYFLLVQFSFTILTFKKKIEFMCLSVHTSYTNIEQCSKNVNIVQQLIAAYMCERDNKSQKVGAILSLLKHLSSNNTYHCIFILLYVMTGFAVLFLCFRALWTL